MSKTALTPAAKTTMSKYLAKLELLKQQMASLKVEYDATLSLLCALQDKHKIDAVEGKVYQSNLIRPTKQIVAVSRVVKLLTYAEYSAIATPTLKALKETLTEAQFGSVVDVVDEEPYLKLTKIKREA